jgi:hypothetical protein
LLVSKDKLKAWLGYGGVFRYLAIACAAVYLFSVFVGLLAWKEGLLSTLTTALSVLVYGAAILALAFLLQKIYRTYPLAAKGLDDGFGLKTDKAMLLLVGVFMLILGFFSSLSPSADSPFQGVPSSAS